MRFSSCWVMGLSNELGAQIRTADFFDVDVNRHAHHLLNFSLQDLDISTLLADHNARTGRVDRDAGVVSRTLDEDTANRGVLQLLFQEAATFRSSPSVREKLRPTAYQRDVQLRVTGRRKPLGLIF